MGHGDCCSVANSRTKIIALFRGTLAISCGTSKQSCTYATLFDKHCPYLAGDILATVQGTISSQQRAGREHLHVDTLDIDLNIKTVRMLVKKVFNNNRILSEYSTRPCSVSLNLAAKCATSVQAATLAVTS